MNEIRPRGTSLPYHEFLGKVGGKRRGFTSGTAAQAAAKAAAAFALSGVREETVSVTLPGGEKPYAGGIIHIPVSFYKDEGEWFHAGVTKDAGDDDDITSGAIIAARVRLFNSKDENETSGGNGCAPGDSANPAVVLRGGKGVGTVTRPGLPVPPGESAINPVPRKMIVREVEQLLSAGGNNNTAEVEIYVPEGEALAAETWNPRLGITGGISIIGTSGVVEPKSSEAYKASIKAVIRSISKQEGKNIIITPGYVGERFLFQHIGVSRLKVATVGDHIGWAFSEAARRNISVGVLAGHIGKCAKIAAGIFNTHWTSGDARLETIAAWAGFEGAPPTLIRKVLSCGLAEESVPILLDAGYESVFTRIAEQCVRRLEGHLHQASERRAVQQGFAVSAVILDLDGQPIAAVPGKLKEKAGWEAYL